MFTFLKIITSLVFMGVKLTHHPNSAASYIKGPYNELAEQILYSDMYSVVQITCFEDNRCEECFGLKKQK
jgi:hypothetical protein